MTDAQRRPRPITPRVGTVEWLAMVGTSIVLLAATLFALLLLTAGARGLIDGEGNDADPTGFTAQVTDLVPPTQDPQAGIVPTDPPAGVVATPSVSVEDPSLTVCLDVGHGGIDLGNAPLNSAGTEVLVMEKELLLPIALEVESRLRTEGFNVAMTRRDDRALVEDFRDVNGDGITGDDNDGDGVLSKGDTVNNLDELQARVLACNDAGADLLVSMHFNGSENPALAGYESWWAAGRLDSDRSAAFAQIVTDALGERFTAAGFETTFRGSFDDQEFDDAEPEPGDFQHYVMLSPDVPERNFVGSTMPGAIIETLFLSNEDDRAFVLSEVGQEAIVAAYVDAIVAYFAAYPEPVDNGSLPPDSPDRATTNPIAGPPATVVDVAAVPGTDQGAVTPQRPVATARPAPPPDQATGASLLTYSGASGRREVALTFDAGQDRGFTAEILDYLAGEAIDVSFGITGQWAEANQDLVVRMVEEGHQIFNHTYSHRSFTGVSTPWEPESLATWERIEEVERTHQIVADLTGGYDMRPYFRPPYGDYGPQSLADLATIGYYQTIMWTVDSFGWKGWTAAEIAQHCITKAEPGGILLFHVGNRSADFEALPAIVEGLRDDGYAMVTVEQLLQP